MIVRQPGGATVDLGQTEQGPTISLQDYSRLETDEFGVTTVVKRGFSRKMSVRLAVATDQVDSVQRRLADLRAKTTLWTADPDYAWLTVDGYYTDFSVDFAVPPLSYCSLTIEGLAETETVPDAGGDPAPDGNASDLCVLQPIDVTDGILLSSNVPETDAPQWASGTTYSLGAKVVAAHRVFESLVASNVGNAPATSPGAWLDIGPTNRWAMFDQALGTTTSRSSSIVVTLPAGQIKALTLLDVVGTSVRVQAPRATEPHYDRTVSVTGAAITFLDLPGVNGTATVTITGSGTVSVGTLLAGRLLALGRTEAAPTAGIIDYSTKEVDDFGEVTLVERAWAKEMSLRSLIRSDAVDVVGNRIAALRGQPCLWIGREGQDALSVYGFFKDFSIEVLQNVSKVSLSIQGLSAAAAVEGVAALPVPWPSITDPVGTKPADNATVGAPPGTNVGGIPAEEVVSRLDTLNTETIPSINEAMADANDRIVAARQAADAGIASANTRLDGVRDDLAVEVARAVGADEAISTRIDAIVAEGGYDDTQVRALIQSEATARADGDRALGQRVDTVTTDYKAADTSTNTRISSVETAYADADRALGQRIDTVVTDYKAGDTATNTRITSEATASSDRDAALGRRIDSIVAEGGYDDTDVRAEISRVETAAVSRDQALGQRIDTTQASFGDAINAKAQEITTAYAAADKSLADRIRVTEASSVVGGEALNANASFAVWPESDPYPSRWIPWGDVGPVNRLANSLGGGGFMVEHSPAGINSGLLVPNVFLTRGWYVMEADVWLTSGSWNGAGMTLHGEYSLDFMSEKDVAEDIGNTSSGGVRRFRKLFQVPAGGEGYKNLHLMSNWDSFGRGYTAKTVRWLRCGVRPATDAEIASRKVEAANVIARVTAAETALTDGRFATAQRAANIEAAVGAVGGRVSAVETVTSNGTFATAARAEQIASYAGDVEAKVDLQAGTIAGLGQKTAAYVRFVADAGGGRAALSLWSDQYGGAWTLTGDGLIDGNLTVNGTITTSKIAPGAVTGSVGVETSAATAVQPGNTRNNPAIGLQASIGAPTGSIVRIDIDRAYVAFEFTQPGQAAPIYMMRLVRVQNGVVTQVQPWVLAETSAFQRKIFLDTPAAGGTATYRLEYATERADGSNGPQWSVNNQLIILTELKR